MDSFATFTISALSSTFAVTGSPIPLAAHEDIVITTSVPLDEERRTSGANCYCIIA